MMDLIRTSSSIDLGSTWVYDHDPLRTTYICIERTVEGGATDHDDKVSEKIIAHLFAGEDQRSMWDGILE